MKHKNNSFFPAGKALFRRRNRLDGKNRLVFAKAARAAGEQGAEDNMLQLMKPGFGTILPGDSRAHEEWVAALVGRDYLIERWHCDLSTGIFSVGETTKTRHCLGDRLCGLLDIIRNYHEDHHKTVLNILEEATAAESSFCFCTMLQEEDGGALPVFCVGTSTVGASLAGGRMQGIFAFAPADG